MRTRNATGVVCILIIFLFVLSGCDQLQSFSDYFSPKTSQQQKNPSPANQPKPMATTQPQRGPTKPNVLAKVGSWTITIEDFNQRLNNLQKAMPNFDANDLESKKVVLNELIRQQLLVLDAEKTGIANSKDIKDAVEEFRTTLIVREAATKIIEGINATEDEAKAWYEQNKEFLVEPPTWKVREIVASTQAGAKELLVGLLQGNDDFAQVARERSIGKSASKGGDLGVITEAPFEEMQNVLATLEEGDISSVFRGPEGFYIIKVEEKTGGQQKEFEELKDEIIAGVAIQKQQEALIRYIDNIESKTNIYRNEKLLEK